MTYVLAWKPALATNDSPWWQRPGQWTRDLSRAQRMADAQAFRAQINYYDADKIVVMTLEEAEAHETMRGL